MHEKWSIRWHEFFHYTLAGVIFLQSARTVYHGFIVHSFGVLSVHAGALATIEALGSILFIIPATVTVGGVLLLLVFAAVVVVHGIFSELPLIVYAAGVILVMATQGRRSGKS